MEKESAQNENMASFAEQTPRIQFKEPELPEPYKKAFLENDTGVSNEYCLNTTSWD